MSNKKSRRYMEQASEIRGKLGDRDYILGLDLGVGSIGSAVVALHNVGNGRFIPADIVYSGARVFPASSGAADRRAFRSQRNSLRHRKNRLKWLWKTLAEKGLMLPFSTEEVPDPAVLRFSEETRSNNPYELRLKGLSQELNLNELGYALYHLANHRGSSSVFANDESKSKSDSKYGPAKDATAKYSSEGAAFIEVLYRANEDRKVEVYRNTGSDAKPIAPMPTRDLIENELSRLLDRQMQYHPEVLTPEYVARIRNSVLYENEMLVPEAENCPYFPEEKKLPKMAFINEERRLWEALNNVRFTVVEETKTGEIVYNRNVILDDQQREECFKHLYSGKDLTPAFIKKLMPEFELQDIKLQGLSKKEQKIKGFQYCSLRENPYYSILSEEDKNTVLALWTNSVSPDRFLSAVEKTIGLGEDAAKSILDCIPKTGTGSYALCGLSAMKVFLPYIIGERLSFGQAVDAAIMNGQINDNSSLYELDKLPYYGVAMPASMQMLMGKAWHSSFKDRVGGPGFHKPCTDANEEKYGRIANPVVHQTLNELQKLVNELIEILGKKPAFVRIETARELKVGQEERQKIANDNNARAKLNESIIKKYLADDPPVMLMKKGLGHCIKTFRIWEDQGCTCPYCFETINEDAIKNGNADLDHIFPREDVPGNPENNLVVAHKLCNEKKGKRIPYAAFSQNSEWWNRLLNHLEENNSFKSKLWRFTMTSEGYEEWLKNHGMMSRFKTDNSYISRVAVDYLSTLFSKDQLRHKCVNTIRGAETAMLRKAWKVESITDELAALYQKDGENSVSKGGKNRIDIRHHALDAIVVAYSNPSMIRDINTLNARGADYDSIQNHLRVPEYFRMNDPVAINHNLDVFVDYLRNKIMNDTFISRKIDHGTNGELLKGTSYSYIGSEGDALVYWTKKPVSGMNVESMDELKKKLAYSVPKWLCESDKARIEAFVHQNSFVEKRVETNINVAKSILEQENQDLIAIGKKPRNITAKTVMQRALLMTGGKYYQISNGLLSKMFATRKPQSGMVGNVFDTGDNYCIDLYYDNAGKIQGEVIRKIDFVSNGFKPRYVEMGYKRAVRLFSYDVLEISCGEGSVTNVKTPHSFEGRTYVIPLKYTARASGSIQLWWDVSMKEQPNPDVLKSVMIPSTIQKQSVRLVLLSSAGLVKYVSPELKDLS